jgi:hypothetical protein
MITKELSSDELENKLGEAFVKSRPQLAYYILSGQTSYSEKGETYALRGSRAVRHELVTKDEPLEQRRDLGNEIREEIEADKRPAEAEPRPALLRAPEPEPAKAPAKVGHTKIAALFEGKADPSPLRSVKLGTSRIEAQRADHAARNVGRFNGKRPSKMASMLDGTEPKGAA